MSANATIVIEFGAGADSGAFVALELDETLNLGEDGEEQTQFSPGDEVWFWLQHDASLRVGAVAATSGMVVDCGMVRRSRLQELTWINEDAQELSHIPAANPSYTWYGNAGSGMVRDGRSVTVTGNLPCTADAAIPIDVHLYRFVPPPLELADDASYRVVVVITMEAA
ncbi:MAG TPA: hypothetical protein PKW90_23430 [Myxococcota bacterium]|nr:hypothetical protein [Myxococcota bacterium]